MMIMMIAIHDDHDDGVYLGPIVHEDNIPNIEKGVSAQNPNKRLWDPLPAIDKEFKWQRIQLTKNSIGEEFKWQRIHAKK